MCDGRIGLRGVGLRSAVLGIRGSGRARGNAGWGLRGWLGRFGRGRWRRRGGEGGGERGGRFGGDLGRGGGSWGREELRACFQ